MTSNEIEIEKTVFNWQIIPNLNQSAVYEAVCKRLGEGACFGIFPEGGSHDRTTLLPLKVGIVLMSYQVILEYGVEV